MQETIPSKQYTDPVLQAGNITGLHLYIHFSYESMSYIVFHPQENRIYSCKSYEGIMSQVHFDQVFSQDPILKSPYQRVGVMFSNPLFSFIPEELFDPAAISTYLNFNLLEPDSYFQEQNFVKALRSYTVFCINREPKIVVNKYHPQNTVFHSSTPMIEGLLREYQEAGKLLFIFASSSFEIEIVVLENGKLLLYNYFQVSTEEEFIYYPLYVSQQFGINRDQIQLTIGGLLDQDHPWIASLNPYFRNIRQITLPKSLSFAAGLVEKTGALAWSLAWLSQCE